MKMENRKGAGQIILGIFVVALIAVLAMGTGMWFAGDKGSSQPGTYMNIPTTSGGNTQVTDKELAAVNAQKDMTSCSGIASVKILYDDKNGYTLGTDPATNMTIYDPVKKLVADDATSTNVPVLSTFKGLAANHQGTPSSTYFGSEVSFSTVCADKDFQPELFEASAPTITIVNDNGVTLNSDSNHETADADSEYTAYLTIKAPAKKCSAVYGAAVVFEYDATYVRSIASTDLVDYSETLNIAHVSNQSGSGLNFDQYKIMKFEGDLCNGGKVDDIGFTIHTTGSAPGEDQANVKIHWLPLNKDLNVDTYEVITGLYDEDNTAIYLGNTTSYYYTA